MKNLAGEMLTIDDQVNIDDQVKFMLNYLDLHWEGKVYSCSLSGQFLKGDEPFDPPLVYSLTKVRVTTDNLSEILAPIYYSLLAEREKMGQGKRSKKSWSLGIEGKE